MSQKDAFITNRTFWAAEHYPKGIGRSGLYTNEQTKLLENHGYSYQELVSGDVPPRNAEEAAFVAVFKGNIEAKTPHEKVWQYFLDKTNQKKRIHYSVGSDTSSFDATNHVDNDNFE